MPSAEFLSEVEEPAHLGGLVGPSLLIDGKLERRKYFTQTSKTVERITECSERKDPGETFTPVFSVLRPAHT